MTGQWIYCVMGDGIGLFEVVEVLFEDVDEAFFGKWFR